LLLGHWLHCLFHFFFVKLSQSHTSSNMLVELTQVDLGFFFLRFFMRLIFFLQFHPLSLKYWS
jgi:hypothetical protein